MLRRLKQDVDLAIPPKKEILVYAPLSKIQSEFYEATVNRTILKVMEVKNVINTTKFTCVISTVHIVHKPNSSLTSQQIFKNFVGR